MPENKEPERLECWVTTSGETGCADCGGDFTGSKPVALLPPRTCVFCKKPITDKWPRGVPHRSG